MRFDVIGAAIPQQVIGPVVLNPRAVEMFEERESREAAKVAALQFPGAALIEGFEEETRAALMERDAKIAAIAAGAAFLLGVRGLALIAIAAAPFVLAGNATYRDFAWRVPV